MVLKAGPPSLHMERPMPGTQTDLQSDVGAVD
jgi:hypothetical protein